MLILTSIFLIGLVFIKIKETFKIKNNLLKFRIDIYDISIIVTSLAMMIIHIFI